MEQLEGRDLNDLEAAELQPISLGMPTLKEIGAQWLVEMAEYISENPQFIVNGFICSQASHEHLVELKTRWRPALGVMGVCVILTSVTS